MQIFMALSYRDESIVEKTKIVLRMRDRLIACVTCGRSGSG